MDLLYKQYQRSLSVAPTPCVGKKCVKSWERWLIRMKNSDRVKKRESKGIRDAAIAGTWYCLHLSRCGVVVNTSLQRVLDKR